MPKTYTNIGTFTAGQTLTAAQMNEIGDTLDNHTVPPSCMVYRSTDVNPYTGNAAISWSAKYFDTDSMWSSGATITIGTSGLYHVSFIGYMTATATLTRVSPYVYSSGVSAALFSTTASFTSTECKWNVGGICKLTAGDQLDARVFILGGSAHIMKGGANPDESTTRLGVVWIGRDA